jgi:hypothetical protein
MDTALKIILGINIIGFLYKLKLNIPKLYIYINNYEKIIVIFSILFILYIAYIFIENYVLLINENSFIKKELIEIRKLVEEIHIHKKDIYTSKNTQKRKKIIINN